MKFKLGNFKVNGSPLIFLYNFAILFWFGYCFPESGMEVCDLGIVASLAVAYICTPFLIVTGRNKTILSFGCNPEIADIQCMADKGDCASSLETRGWCCRLIWTISRGSYFPYLLRILPQPCSLPIPLH